MTPKNICLIPARGGSKRIPRKNIKPFHGKPLISWSIQAAISSGLFDNIYVSTDDEEIASIGEEYGAIIPFIRPKDIANDYASDLDVRNHFIDWSKRHNIPYDFLCYLYPTAPFVQSSTLIGCLEKLLTTEATCSLTVSTSKFPILQSLIEDSDGFLDYLCESYKHLRTQDLQQTWFDAGQCYFFNMQRYNQPEKRIGFPVPQYLAHDIDTLDDWYLAELIFTALKSRGWDSTTDYSLAKLLLNQQ